MLPFAMKRKQKRFLQMTLLFMVALIFLPNIGLWSLYKDKHLVKSPEPGEQQTFPLGLGDGQLYTWTDGLKRKDWHNYQSIQKDAMRTGKGEHGKPYPLTEEDRDDSAYRENGFNILVSNNIALERSLPDIRHPNCKHKVYLEKLPNTSIIIPFHNEGWTSLLRTIYSIINRTPDILIAEIILVDDFSDREHLKEKLEEYMARFAKVRIVRTKKREGLIRTRLLGASMAKGEVLTFLDSHCEVNVNWLPPLLNQIALNHKTIVCPMIDVIDHNHFGYEAQAGDAMRGAFDWEMYYKRIPIPPELQRSDPSDPFESPVMAGGLFAVDRKWFWELGGYDPGLEIWGGEQYEISFKVWMCGGGMFDVPCSRVGHIYRKYVPYKVPSGTSLARNLKRVAETWMDEFAEYVYQRRPEYRHLSTGDISAQKELRKHLKCKDFKWFMAAVAWDVPKYYPPVEPPPAAWGEIRNVAANLCVDSKHGATGAELRLDVCVKDGSERTWSHEQGMKDRGHNRDPKQCRVKLKELRQAYQKTREANGCSGSEPKTCRFYDELHAILGGSATTTPAVLFDSFNGDGGNMEAGFGDKEDEEEEEVVDSSQQASGETSFPDSQELFLTLDLEPVPPEPTQGCLLDPAGGEGTSAACVSRITGSSPSQRLAKIRRRKKRTRDEMFSELMLCSHTDRAQTNLWRQTISECRKALNDQEERWQAEESKWRAEERAEAERWRQRDERRQDSMLRLLEDQTNMLQRMVELQEGQQEHRPPLQPLCNQLPSSPSSIASSPRR
ncbi:polypeptide N-acetylgalactosaminyltransferase-like 6 isoform X1 [Natator depressus]|uniref:polypeptide N-acetylgalactosaminyltransferase-like 6 isoform X1 n=2 Tax=Natator depressus TaxID=27790 RepID=UPI003EBE55D1